MLLKEWISDPIAHGLQIQRKNISKREVTWTVTSIYLVYFNQTGFIKTYVVIKNYEHRTYEKKR